MGQRSEAVCRACGHTFEYNDPGGFTFSLLHYDTCGRERSVDHNALPGEPRESWEEWEAAVERIAGACRCGGRFLLETPPRCRKCRSTDVELGGPTVMYD